MTPPTAGTCRGPCLHGPMGVANSQRYRGGRPARRRVCMTAQHAEAASVTGAPRMVSDTAAAHLSAQPQHSAHEVADSAGGLAPVALKEWAVVCAALACGEQTVLLRKGGIREPTFRPAGRRFLLLPTSFHSAAGSLKLGAADRYAQALSREPKDEPEVLIEAAAEVTGAWTTTDPAVLDALDGFHIWTPEYLQTRLRFRAKQQLTVLELRCRRLTEPLLLHNSPELWGCFTWAPLPEGFGITDEAWRAATPALGDAEFSERQHALRRAVAGIEAEALSF